MARSKYSTAVWRSNILKTHISRASRARLKNIKFNLSPTARWLIQNSQSEQLFRAHASQINYNN